MLQEAITLLYVTKKKLKSCGEDFERNFTVSADVYSDFSELNIQLGNGSRLRIDISMNPKLYDILVLSKINEIFIER